MHLRIACKSFISSRNINLNVKLATYEVNNTLSRAGLFKAVFLSSVVYNP